MWGSDWLHPGEREKKPDDAILFDLLLVWAPDEKVRHRILVENPAVLRPAVSTSLLQPQYRADASAAAHRSHANLPKGTPIVNHQFDGRDYRLYVI